MTDENGQNALHALAAYGNSAAAMEALLTRMPPSALTATSTAGITPLFLAARSVTKGAREQALLLLEKTPKESLGARNVHGANLLHSVATSAQGLDLAQYLAAVHGECLVQQDVQGRTPLHRAVAHGKPETVLTLMGASPPAVLSMCDSDGWCPLELALFRGRLITMFASRPDIAMEKLIELSIEYGVLEKKEWKMTTPLHGALSRAKGSIAQISRLPQAKEWALVPCPTTGLLPTHYIACQWNLGRRLELATIADTITPACLTTPVVGSKETVLHLCLVYRNDQLAAELLDAYERYLDVDASDNEGDTAFVAGLKQGSARPRPVLSRVLQMSKTDCPLTVRQWRELREEVDMGLLLEICERYPRNFFHTIAEEDWLDGLTPLHCACRTLKKGNSFEPCDDVDLYQQQLQHLLPSLPHWFVAVKDHRGYTPIHTAVSNGNLPAVEVLLDIPGAEEAVMEVV
eukprot:CAMPEP_0114608452 /NCGR_PEP_ID=MMETSP0168-20121206/2586_1 /TAXON_ID=95228 ORGANISM="Vannella sp., Strain DIVA3 517/6/12" /NCGR_SAMPLE_ID=MMETSP0168 /ASSEMBLY_ACC=CAM_ASM_000044 /LENGTH=460 /DNA_ID=CAMNT_0001819351 /DNA_START=117 /DNA_END=1495 /DNA_ORIENTATION=+